MVIAARVSLKGVGFKILPEGRSRQCYLAVSTASPEEQVMLLTASVSVGISIFLGISTSLQNRASFAVKWHLVSENEGSSVPQHYNLRGRSDCKQANHMGEIFDHSVLYACRRLGTSPNPVCVTFCIS
jgi:hypothetical protein